MTEGRLVVTAVVQWSDSGTFHLKSLVPHESLSHGLRQGLKYMTSKAERSVMD